MEREKFLKCRNEILKIMEEAGTDRWEAVRITASALNEFLASDGHQAIVTLRPLVAYCEADDKI